MIRSNAARCPISAQCGMPGVPRSTHYWMIEHPETERADPIAGDVRAAWRDGRERHGARKIKAAPERRGVTASRRRIGNIMREHEQAAEEGAHVPEPLHHDRAAEARPQRLRVAVRQPAAPLHPRIPEPEGIHRTRTRPLRNCPTHRCQSTSRSSRGSARRSTAAASTSHTIRSGLSNARLEAVNNKIKTTIKIGYGYRNLGNLIALIMLKCDGLNLQLPGRQ